MTAPKNNATASPAPNAHEVEAEQPSVPSIDETTNVAADTAASRHGAATTARHRYCLSCSATAG